MNNIEIKGYRDVYFVPSVNFNAETGACEMIGESYLEDTVEFYEKLNKWLEDYYKTGKPLTFDFKLTYFNTSSSKRIVELLRSIKGYELSGGDVTVRWHFIDEEEDSDLIEEVEDFKLMSDLDIDFVFDEE